MFGDPNNNQQETTHSLVKMLEMEVAGEQLEEIVIAIEMEEQETVDSDVVEIARTIGVCSFLKNIFRCLYLFIHPPLGGFRRGGDDRRDRRDDRKPQDKPKQSDDGGSWRRQN